MKKFKKMLRLLALVFLIVLATTGIGVMGSILPSYRERYSDNEIKIELIEKKDDESEHEINESKE